METPKNIEELRAQLLEAFAKAQSNDEFLRPRAIALKSMVAAAGCIIGSIKTELAYAALRGETVCIPFMHYETRTAVSETSATATIDGYKLLTEIHNEIEQEAQEA